MPCQTFNLTLKTWIIIYQLAKINVYCTCGDKTVSLVNHMRGKKHHLIICLEDVSPDTILTFCSCASTAMGVKT